VFQYFCLDFRASLQISSGSPLEPSRNLIWWILNKKSSWGLATHFLLSFLLLKQHFVFVFVIVHLPTDLCLTYDGSKLIKTKIIIKKYLIFIWCSDNFFSILNSRRVFLFELKYIANCKILKKLSEPQRKSEPNFSQKKVYLVL
jgi:hypothetical protein